jgi:glycosyltransferase involved in cell wall biosynthesis
MTRIAILGTSLYQGDAVGNDMLGMYEHLTRHGHDVRIFANAWDERFRDLPVAPSQQVAAHVRDDGAVIYHFAQGWSWAIDELQHLTCRRIIRDHNTTPPGFFASFSQEHVEACTAGERDRAVLARIGADLYLSDSAFNRACFEAAGAPPDRCRVVPPFHQVDRLLGQDVSFHLLQACRDGWTNLLSVGRVAPNKGHPLLLETFAVYHHDYNPRSRLLIVGRADRRLMAYAQQLQRLECEHGIEDAVVWLPTATEAELKTCYLVANTLLVTSQHEGFCVPAIEGMALRVPIVALGEGAVPETVGEAGLVWEEADPELLAASIDAVVREESVREMLTSRGTRRYRQCFSNERVAESLFTCLEGCL